MTPAPEAPASAAIWARYGRYLQAAPHMVMEWRDEPTGARGWLILNSLRGGAAGGGTRMRAGVTREEVTYLAKAMELKFAFSGPPIGGGKSGIDFDASDPRKREVLRRWFRDMRPLLRECYGTGGDVNVDEQRDVLPLCREVGLAHPQQGIVQGHMTARGTEIVRADRSLRAGLAMPVTDPVLGLPGLDVRVSDLVTGYGVSRAVLAAVAGGGGGGARPLDGVRIVVEGFGAVGGPAALYLARLGARIVGLVDARAALPVPEGLDAAAVEGLLRARDGRELPDHPDRVTGPARERVYETPADVFVPAAVSGSVDGARMDRLKAAGVTTLVCGANQPIRESTLGDTANLRRADEDFAVVADVVASMGMARAFHFLMAEGPVACPEDVFGVVNQTMTGTVSSLLVRNGGCRPGLLGTTLEDALDRIGFERLGAPGDSRVAGRDPGEP